MSFSDVKDIAGLVFSKLIGMHYLSSVWRSQGFTPGEIQTKKNNSCQTAGKGDKLH